MKNLLGWSAQYLCAWSPCCSNDRRQSSLRHALMSVLEAREERRSARRVVVESGSNMVDGGGEVCGVAEEGLRDKDKDS